MKKYLFTGACGAILLSLALGSFLAAAGLGAVLFAWLARETQARRRFLSGPAIQERAFELGADPAWAELAADGGCMAAAGMDRTLSLRLADGSEAWSRPVEPGLLALLPVAGGRCYYALGDEVVLADEQGAVIARAAFVPPPFRQNYRLVMPPDQSVLLLHTPWFLQFFDPGLGSAGGRISCEEAGHYLKYCALGPAGDRVFFAGAKLLEEERSTEARWALWTGRGGAWRPAWQVAEDGYGNSHLRGAWMSADGETCLAEIHREGYEFRLWDGAGREIWRRAGEHPVLSPDGRLVLWEGPSEGLALSEAGSGRKWFSRKCEDPVRFKALDSEGNSLVLEGRRLVKSGPSGQVLWQSYFISDPFRIQASRDASRLGVLRGRRGAFIHVPF